MALKFVSGVSRELKFPTRITMNELSLVAWKARPTNTHTADVWSYCHWRHLWEDERTIPVNLNTFECFKYSLIRCCLSHSLGFITANESFRTLSAVSLLYKIKYNWVSVLSYWFSFHHLDPPFLSSSCLSLLLWLLLMVWPTKPVIAGHAAIATRKYSPPSVE